MIIFLQCVCQSFSCKHFGDCWLYCIGNHNDERSTCYSWYEFGHQPVHNCHLSADTLAFLPVIGTYHQYYQSISSEEIHEEKVKMKVTWYMMDSEMSVCSPLQKFFSGTHRGGKTENKYITVEMMLLFTWGNLSCCRHSGAFALIALTAEE